MDDQKGFDIKGRSARAETGRAAAPDNPLGHTGELEMRRRFPGRYRWDERNLSSMMSTLISTSMARFIEAQSFFFIATASADGHCDASFRGREYDTSGTPLPALKTINERQLIFPDHSGNGLYNSLGNILSNPHIGMLFIDFEQQRRARINGIAAIVGANDETRKIWPTARNAVLVTVEQAYGNCQARIPRMEMIEGSDR
ncbi:MAG: pyridoxamine 5'-phosphate oxidase family protein [Proteobacteria bacterium]|nr:pyridoxamine 5'-phosphate oxidase family protein [Pseudomonadota bacterium]